jgi:hypothetical protein
MIDLAIVFREATLSMYGTKERFARFMRRQEPISYFTPGETPSGALVDGDGTFSVGVMIPTFASAGGGVVALHMYVRDKGDSREAELYCPESEGGSAQARQAINRILSEMRAHDRDLWVRAEG